MKTLITAAALAIVSSTGLAQEATQWDPREFVSTKTRAEVQAEVMVALAQGERLRYGETRSNKFLTTESVLTRAEVQAPVIAALASGQRLSYGEAGQRWMATPPRAAAPTTAFAAARMGRTVQ